MAPKSSPVYEHFNVDEGDSKFLIVRSIITDAKLNQAILDQKTRWNSTYVMIERLLDLKAFCQEKAPLFKGLRISEQRWGKLKEMCNVLKPVAELTSRLQHEQLDVTQFVAFWKKAMFAVEMQGSTKAIELRKCVELREKSIFRNRLIQSAIYLDKRFCFTLKSEEAITAKAFILQIEKKRRILAGEIIEDAAESSVQIDNCDINVETNCFDAYMENLARNSDQQLLQAAEAPKTPTVIETELTDYENLPRLPTDTNVMDF